MSIYHCSIKIISRAGGRSAVASAAYRAGEKLYNDETGLTHDFTKKNGVVMNEIILPEHAPKHFLNREVLWNEVQKIEKRSDAQFAREIEVAFPTEMTREEQIDCVRAYIKENFVAKGMIADWALHDKDDGNPHAHIMLTMRGIDEHEKWLKKQKTVFANSRDSSGRPIYDPNLPAYNSSDKENTSKYRIPVLDENGNQKTRLREGKGTEYLWERISVPANDWNDHSQAETWRASWAEHCNRYLDPEQRIDHRSYERQGIDVVPTIHEGVTARKIESEGKTADRCQINRGIRERNKIKAQLREITTKLTQLITEKARGIYERFAEFRGCFGNAEYSRGDAGYSGKTAGRNREFGTGELALAGAAGRIVEIKRAADITGREIETTNSFIDSTDRKIAELIARKGRKEADRDERLRRLRKRREASGHARGDAESDRGSSETAIGTVRGSLGAAREDIRAFLRELEAEESHSAEKRDHSIAERENREAQLQRSSIEAERDIESKRTENKGKRKYRGEER